MRTLVPAFLCSLTAAIGAQAASYTYVDQQPPYANPSPPWLIAQNLPQLGGTFRVEVPYSIYQCCPFEKTFYLATGTANPNLRVDWLGGYLYTTADLFVVATTNGSGGNTVVQIPIPNSPQLLGAHFHQQVLAWARNWFWSTLELSRGGHGVIGL